jgi:RNA polymerase sigma-70 factor (ECF subfamily)
LQESLIDLLRQDPAPDQPVAWLYKTVRRRAMNQARAEQRRSQHHRRAGAERQSWFLPDSGMLDEPLEVEAMLRRLPRLEFEIVVARVWGELTFDQVAVLVGLSTSSAHRHYQRALAQLGEMMGHYVDRSRGINEPQSSPS